jgi:hypothetical protein
MGLLVGQPDALAKMGIKVAMDEPNAPIRIALDDVRCPRCNSHGRTRIAGLARYPSI